MPYSFSESAELAVPATAAYASIADYVNGHPHIIPPKYFRNMRVDAGGYGAGTIVRFDVHAFGTVTTMVGHVTEPKPGHTLVEAYPADGTVTTFVVEPMGASRCRVTIATEMAEKPGLRGMIEKWITPGFLRGLYRQELKRIESSSNEQRATKR
jgi:hypothetical protein